MFGRCSANGARNGAWMGIRWRLTGGVDMKRELPRSGKSLARNDEDGALIVRTPDGSLNQRLDEIAVFEEVFGAAAVAGDGGGGGEAHEGVEGGGEGLRSGGAGGGGWR